MLTSLALQAGRLITLVWLLSDSSLQVSTEQAWHTLVQFGWPRLQQLQGLAG